MNIRSPQSCYETFLNETSQNTTPLDSKSLEIDRRIAGLKLTPYIMNFPHPPVPFRINELYCAIEKRDRIHVQELLKCFNMNELNSDTYGWGTPLASAAERGAHDILLDLVEAGASDVQIDKNNNIVGQTALYYASTCGQEESVRILLALGANPSLKGQGDHGYKLSPLDGTICRGHLNCFKLLVEASPPSYVNEFISQNLTPLTLAFKYGQAEIMEYLMNHGASLALAFPESTEEELMREAVREGNLEVVKLFVKRGISINGKYNDFDHSVTLLTTAKILGHSAVANYLEEIGGTYDKEVVSYGRSKGAYDILKTLCLFGDFYAKWGFSNVDECFAELLPRDIDNIVHETRGGTLLHLVACRHRSYQGSRAKLVKQLLDHGADKEIKDLQGRTAVELAIANAEKDKPYLDEKQQEDTQLVIDQLLYDPAKKIKSAGVMKFYV